MSKQSSAVALTLPSNKMQFAAEEWEDWMEWNGALEALSPDCNNVPRSSFLHFPPSTMPNESILDQYDLSRTQRSTAVEIDQSSPTREDKKRKRITVVDTGDSNSKQHGKKTSHNVIEKRYRSNLNDKIAALRDSVPALRTAARRSNDKGGSSDSERSGQASAMKLNKANVLAKATEYIQQLEKQNHRLQEENRVLRNRPGGSDEHPRPFEAGTRHSASSSKTACEAPSPDAVPSPDDRTLKLQNGRSGSERPVGMIQVPESIRRLRMQSSPEHHYAFEMAGDMQNDTLYPDLLIDDHRETAMTGRGKVMSRLLLGSLAGLMIMEGLNKGVDDESKGHQKRGLFALPSELLKESRGFREPIRRRIIAFVSSAQFQRNLPVLRICFMMGTVILIIAMFSTLFQPKPTSKVDPIESSTASLSNEPLHQVRSAHPSTKLPAPRVPTAVAPSAILLLGMRLRGFFARQAIGLLGCSWLANNPKDEEAAGFSSLRAEDFQRRWMAYANVLPKLFEKRDGA